MTLEVGLATWLPDADPIIERCRQLEVRTIALRAESIPGYGEDRAPDAARLGEIQSKLADAGITISALIQWFGNDPDLVENPGAHRFEIDGMLRTLELQRELGIPRQLHYVDVPEPEDPAQDEAYWGGLISIMKEVVATAEQVGVKIANHGIWRCLTDDLREDALAGNATEATYRAYRPEAWGAPYLVRTADSVHRLVQAVPGDNHGYTLCTGLYITGGDPVAEVKRFGSRINFVQVRDVAGRWPAAREVFPGTGEIDLIGVLRALKDAGYSGFLHPEHLGSPARPEQDLELEATRLVKSWVRQVEG